MSSKSPLVCIIGDTHGHLQLALCMAARWQSELGATFDAVLLCGDAGSFTHESQLDNATRRHGKRNPCELEFLLQWPANPQPEWLGKIFMPLPEGGLGLQCPVAMVHGNHEGFAHLEKLIPGPPPSVPVALQSLPGIDTQGRIRYLPSGWRCVTGSGILVGGIGGIEKGQRQANYHPLAYIDADAVLKLLEGNPLDILVTHQGPAATQGEAGSPSLDILLEAGIARTWFHGHAMSNPEITKGGPDGKVVVVPLGDVAFPAKGPEADDPGENAWAWVCFQPELKVTRTRPEFWREYRRHKWKTLPNGQLVCPALL